tara:strand:- start:3232 stop:4302 length:1071 start_codon:yes stop_codon:yes gene_type:complete
MRAPLKRRFSAWGSSNSIAPDAALAEDSEGNVTKVPPKDPAQEGEVTSLMDTMMMMKKDNEAGPWYLIDPRHSLVMKVWDVVTCSALLFTAVITPYEVGFLPPPESSMEVLFILNRIVDIVFLIDICVHFVLMYPATDSDQSVIWVKSPKRITLHYLKSWFVIDTVSSLVSITDIVAVLEQGSNGQSLPLPSPSLSTLVLTLISALHTRPPSPSTLALILLLRACSLIAAVTARRHHPPSQPPAQSALSPVADYSNLDRVELANEIARRNNLRTLKTLRTLRLLKMVRLVRASASTPHPTPPTFHPARAQPYRSHRPHQSRRSPADGACGTCGSFAARASSSGGRRASRSTTTYSR